jgi:hypothetical protein
MGERENSTERRDRLQREADERIDELMREGEEMEDRLEEADSEAEEVDVPDPEDASGPGLQASDFGKEDGEEAGD